MLFLETYEMLQGSLNATYYQILLQDHLRGILRISKKYIGALLSNY